MWHLLQTYLFIYFTFFKKDLLNIIFGSLVLCIREVIEVTTVMLLLWMLSIKNRCMIFFRLGKYTSKGRILHFSFTLKHVNKL